MSSIAMPRRRCRSREQRQDLRLDGDVERGGRLVGDQQVRLVGERHGDHHALALAARQLVRIGVEPLLGLAAGRPARSSSSVRAPRRRRLEPLCRISVSPICRSMVCSGLSEVIGSWKIMRDPVAADLRAASLVGADQLGAVEADAAARDAWPCG